jgi:hypothetical protein
VTTVTAGFGPYPEAVAFFRRKLNVPTDRWTDLWKEHNAHGFMVAGVSRLSLLDDIRQQVDLAVQGKIDFHEFKQRFTETAWRAGWSAEPGTRAGEVPGGNAFDDPDWKVRQKARQIAARRARIIYETNTRQAYNAGRWRQLTDPDAVQLRPFLQYRHSPESRIPRAQHKAWDGLTLRWDDPWWKTHAPMNGWGCKCSIRALSERDLKRAGKDGPDKAPATETVGWRNPRTGETEQVPVGIDPGFDFNVGAASMSERAAQAFGERVMQLPPAWRDVALGDMRRRAVDWLSDALGPWIDQVRSTRRKNGDSMPVGFMPASAVLRAPQSGPLVLVDDHAIVHIFRDIKDKVSVIDLRRDLPLAIGRADAVLRDKRSGGLIFVRLVERGDRALDDWFVTVAVEPDYINEKSGNRVGNWVKTVSRAQRLNLATDDYELIEGAL